jgi:hypothetical protein
MKRYSLAFGTQISPQQIVFPPNDKIGPTFTELVCTKEVWQVKMQ